MDKELLMTLTTMEPQLVLSTNHTMFYA
uniref:Uncharacterized protein n=1 Tax=Anguilla anguilla TaxID=7936 RepID=A0A0E9UC60_ANGAN